MTEEMLSFVGDWASIIAAIAAIWAAIATARQARLMREASERKRPILIVRASPIKQQPGWYELRISIRNHGDAPVTLHQISLRSPKSAKLLTKGSASRTNALNEQEPLTAMPVEQTQKTLDVDLYAEQVGTRPDANTLLAPFIPTDRAGMLCYLHCPPSASSLKSSPRMISIRSSLSWSDATHRRFTITTKTKLPVVTSDETI